LNKCLNEYHLNKSCLKIWTVNCSTITLNYIWKYIIWIDLIWANINWTNIWINVIWSKVPWRVELFNSLSCWTDPFYNIERVLFEQMLLNTYQLNNGNLNIYQFIKKFECHLSFLKNLTVQTLLKRITFEQILLVQ